MLAAIDAVPAQPAAEFAQRQLLLLGRLTDRLGCGATMATESWGRAAAKLTKQQALILIRVAMRVQSADEDADELVSDAPAAAAIAQQRAKGQRAANTD